MPGTIVDRKPPVADRGCKRCRNIHHYFQWIFGNQRRFHALMSRQTQSEIGIALILGSLSHNNMFPCLCFVVIASLHNRFDVLRYQERLGLKLSFCSFIDSIPPKLTFSQFYGNLRCCILCFSQVDETFQHSIPLCVLAELFLFKDTSVCISERD